MSDSSEPIGYDCDDFASDDIYHGKDHDDDLVGDRDGKPNKLVCLKFDPMPNFLIDYLTLKLLVIIMNMMISSDELD